MANLSVNLSGYGNITAVTINTTGDATIGGRTTSAGFSSSINGTAATPAYNWTSDPNNGPYHSGVADRVEWASAGTDALSIRGSIVVNYRNLSQEANITMGTGRKLILDANATTTDLPLQFNGDPNSGLGWDSADHIRMYSGGAYTFGLVGGIATVPSTSYLDLSGTFIQLSEMVAPGNPAADKVRIYAVVDGGSLTDLAAKFQDGTVDIFAQEV